MKEKISYITKQNLESFLERFVKWKKIKDLRSSNKDVLKYHLRCENFREALIRASTLTKIFKNDDELKILKARSLIGIGKLEKAREILENIETESEEKTYHLEKIIKQSAISPPQTIIHEMILKETLREKMHPPFKRKDLEFLFSKIFNILNVSDQEEIKILHEECGSGYLAHEIKNFNENTKIFGCSIVDQNVLTCRNKKKNNRLLYEEVKLGNAHDIFGKEKFDLIISTMSLLFEWDIEQFLCNRKKILKENGFLAIWIESAKDNNNNIWLDIAKDSFGFSNDFIKDCIEKSNFIEDEDIKTRRVTSFMSRRHLFLLRTASRPNAEESILEIT